MKKFSIAHYIESFAWLFKVIFYLALLLGSYLAFSPLDASFQTKFNDKALHFLGFFVMSLCAQLAHPTARFTLLALGLISFGLLIELIQAYLPYRSFSWWDLAADAAGIGCYFILFAKVLRDKSEPD